MKNKIKIYIKWLLAAASFIMGSLFVLERSKRRSTEDDLEKLKFDIKDGPLTKEEKRIEQQIADIKEGIRIEEKKKIEVPDLKPSEVEEYWKNK